MAPRALVDEVAPRFDATWKELGIDRYRFIRTTSDKHKRVVANLWKRIRKENPDDLYLESYQGWYCVACEAFYTESQLARDGESWVCAIHKRPVTWLDKERSWFFKLSRYAEPLLRHIEQHPEFIRPEQYRNEIVAFLRGGLKDLSVSRTSFSWGIPVPEPDPQGQSHVIYVWMDALTNYLTDLCPDDGTIGGELVARYWPHAVHLIGKDILRFHAVYWPAFLLSAGLTLPKTIFATGWWTVKGEKISKSMPATRVDPVKLADALGVGTFGSTATVDPNGPVTRGGRAIGPRDGGPTGFAGGGLGVDAMRYYLLREVPLGADGDFTFESLFGRFNAELANDLGNLVNRALTLIGKSALEPARDPYLAGSEPHASLERLVAEVIAGAAAELEAFAPSRALETMWKLVREANRYVDQTQPWQLAKDPGKTAELAHVFHNLANTIGVIGGLVSPVLPTTGRVLREWVGVPASELERWPRAEDMHRVVGRVTRDHKPLYPRLDEVAQDKIVKAVIPPEASEVRGPKPEVPPPALATITKEEFDRVDLRVGKILEARAIPKKDRVLELRVDLGEPEPRTIVAGIAQQHKPESLVGKSCVFVANLAPRDMGKGLVSRGMILAAGDEAILTAVAGDVPPGTRVR